MKTLKQILSFQKHKDFKHQSLLYQGHCLLYLRGFLLEKNSEIMSMCLSLFNVMLAKGVMKITVVELLFIHDSQPF